MLNNPKKDIVFISFMGIGDNVMALTALKDFQYNENSIGWIVKSDSIPLIKNVFPDSHSFTIKRKSISRIIFDLKYYLIMIRVVLFLKRSYYKKAIVFDYKELPVALFALLCRIAGVSEVYSCCDRSYRNIFLTKTINMVKYKDVHEVERYRELFGLVLQPAKSKNNIDFKLPFDEDIFRIHNLKLHGNKKIALAPGSDRAFKRWRVENWIELALRLTKQGYHVFLLGGSDDRATCDRIMNQLPYETACNFAGCTDLISTTALIKKVELLIANDTALMHLADFVGVTVVGLFGITRPQRCGPYNQMNNVIVATSHESGIYSYGKFKKWNDSCINTISVDSIWRKVQEVVNSKV
jgi:ADP-heptose:LPS heptosyltransferase